MSVRPALFLLHPAWACALAVLIVNDWVLKGSGWLAPVVTGKLSDFAGMAVAPALLATLSGVCTRRGLFRCHLALALVFGLLKLVPALPAACERGAAFFGVAIAIRCDPSDLLALPLLIFSYRLSARSSNDDGIARAWRRLATAVAGATGLLACFATSMPIPNPPVLGPKTVTYYDHSGDWLYVLDRATGRTLADRPFEQQPLVMDDIVIASDDETVRATDLVSGRLLWRRSYASWPRVMPCENALFVTDNDSGTWLTETRSGQRIVHLDINPYYTSCAHGLVLHAEAWEKSFFGGKLDLIARDARTAERVWRFRTQGLDVGNAQAFGPFVLAYAGHRLQALDPATGQVRWNRPQPSGVVVTGPSHAVAMDPGEFVVFGTDGATSWGKKGFLFAASEQRLFVRRASRESELTALETATGRVLWSLDRLDRSWVWITTADDDLLVAQPDSEPGLVAIDAATGKPRWRFAPTN